MSCFVSLATGHHRLGMPAGNMLATRFCRACLACSWLIGSAPISTAYLRPRGGLEGDGCPAVAKAVGVFSKDIPRYENGTAISDDAPQIDAASFDAIG